MQDFAFKLIKLLDNLQDYSKESVMKEYESSDDEISEILNQKAVYPNGEQLGFYNYSKNDLSKLSKINKAELKDEFIDYIDSFSENVLDILDSLDTEDKINQLSDDELSALIKNLSIKSDDDFLATLISQIISKNDVLIENIYDNDFLPLLICAQLKQNSLNAGLKSQEYSEITDLLNIPESGSSSVLIANTAFREDREKLKEILSDFKSDKLILTVSSTFFDENADILNSIKRPNYLKALISLPIFQKNNHMMLIILDSEKTSHEFLLIDEADSIIHKENSYDYSFADYELIPNIVNSYMNFRGYENGLILPVSALITKKSKLPVDLLKEETVSTTDPVKKRVYRSDVDKIIELQEQQAEMIHEMQRNSTRGSQISEVDTFGGFSSRVEELMYTKKRQPLENLLYKHDKPLLDEEVVFKNLKDIADLRAINQKNDKDTILIAACKECSSKLVYYNHDIEEIRPDEIYIEIDNISSDVLKQFLYVYLNSLNGLDEIRYFSKNNFRITPEQMGYVKIPVLKITTQFELVDAVRESEEFFKTIELLKRDFQSNILDYKHVINSINELRGNMEFGDGEVKLSGCMRHAYNSLIWPLAISYLNATKRGFEVVEKKENYLVLFEFIAAFNFVILLSGLPDRVYRENKRKIWNARNLNIYKDMTFGKWVILSKNIAKVYKENNFTSKLDEDLFRKISSRRIMTILDKTLELRNKESHSGQSNKHEAKKVLDELNIYLEDIFDILDVYSNYKLIYVVGHNDFTHRVILLNGACAPPIYETLTFDEVLQNNQLYLYNPRNNKKLLIKDSLMKFKLVDEEKNHWALFIYDFCDKREFYAEYKCYQSKEEPYRQDIHNFLDDIIG